MLSSNFEIAFDEMKRLVKNLTHDATFKMAKQNIINKAKQIFQLLQEKLGPEKRKSFKAYDGINNLFNLAYEVLSLKIRRALIKAKLEPYLGFIHSVQWGKPSLICDFQELYRYLIDDFVIGYCQGLRKKDFTIKTEDLSSRKKGKREYLDNYNTKEFMKQLNTFFISEFEVPRMKVGKRQTIET